jgi:hypothetical protein
MAWDTRANGHIKLCPLAGYSTVMIADTACGLRLEYVETPEALQTGTFAAVQLSMLPGQARELAQALFGMADKADSARPAGHAD